MRIPEMMINVMCDDVILPFQVTGAPNVYDTKLIEWLFSGITRQTLLCSGPITQSQLDFLRSTETTGELIYQNQMFRFNRSRITDIVERSKAPLIIKDLKKIFYRKYDEYISFYFLLINGLGETHV